MAFIAGPYTATWKGVDIGKVEAGFDIETALEGESIMTDDLGNSVQDVVYLGGNCFISMILSEYDKARTATLIHPYASAQGAVGRVGRIHLDTGSTWNGALVLTKIVGSNAVHSSVTFPKCIIAPGTIRILLASRHLKVPVRMQALANGSVGAETWYSAT